MAHVETSEQPEWTARPRSCRQVDSALSDGDAGGVRDRARIWEVRKYCQVKPALVQHNRGKDDGKVNLCDTVNNDVQNDAALSALLRSLVHELDADLAMISLLDDEKQYFLAGASREGLSSASVTLESTRWYGCDFVLHHGGLCERTVKMVDLPAIYEVLDMTKNEQTKDLPFVNGTEASFRHYAGSPIVTADGMVIGTVFTFSTKPSTGVVQRQRQFLSETSANVMRQLVQAVRALEGTRSKKFNIGVASLLDACTTYMRAHDVQPHSNKMDSERNKGQYAPFVLKLYEQVAELLVVAFEIDGSRIQEVRPRSQATSPGSRVNPLLAEFLSPKASQHFDVPEETIKKLLSSYPQGGVFHLIDPPEYGEYITASGYDSQRLQSQINSELRRCFPNAQQILFMPMWDTFHNRTVAVTFGCSSSYERVYANNSDLAQLSAFCSTAMSQIGRMESQVMDQTKADFLGSISHGMRSPLHAILGGLELLGGTKLNAEQLDLVHSAQAGGNDLLDTINKILQYAKIGTASNGADEGSQATANSFTLSSDRVNDVQKPPDEVGLLEQCEKIVTEVAHKTQTIALMTAQAGPDGAPPMTYPVVTTLDVTSAASNIPLVNYKAFGVVLENLLANSLKYSGIDCCLRTTITVDDENVTATVTDCGRGISADFLRHSLFVPFSQANPIESGTGLGLPIVKRTVDALKGTVRIESDENIGTIAEAVIPLKNLVSASYADRRPASLARSSHIPNPLHAQLFVPPVWSSGVYGAKGDRLVHNLFSSLTRNLQGWVPSELKTWEKESELPDVIFVRQGDAEAFEENCGERYANTAKVFISGKPLHDSPHVSRVRKSTADTGPVVEIRGPLLPSKLGEALDTIFDESGNAASNGLVDGTVSIKINDEAIGETEDQKPANGITGTSTPMETEIFEEDESAALKTTPLNGYSKPPDSESSPAGQPLDRKSEDTTNTDSPAADDRTTPEPQKTQPEPEFTPGPSYPFPTQPRNGSRPPIPPKEPRLLLVDDNAINLKLLRLYVAKCGILETSTVSATNGREAIEAYTRAISDNNPFSLCFMDLSMPEVDGFQATSEIRRLETENGVEFEERLAIVAFTGLVSGKDRSAAVDAGVDDYITKPAKVKNVQEMLEKWKVKGADGAG